MDMNKRDKNYIERRLNLLRGTAKELKDEFKISKNKLLEELYLEIECYTDEINSKIKLIERRKK